MTNLGGEQRFAAAVARRLQSLGALTRGDRRAASGVDLSESNFDSPLGRKSLRCACTLLASEARARRAFMALLGAIMEPQPTSLPCHSFLPHACEANA